MIWHGRAFCAYLPAGVAVLLPHCLQLCRGSNARAAARRAFTALPLARAFGAWRYIARSMALFAAYCCQRGCGACARAWLSPCISARIASCSRSAVPYRASFMVSSGAILTALPSRRALARRRAAYPACYAHRGIAITAAWRNSSIVATTTLERNDK